MLMIAEFLEVTFSRHGTCKLLYDTSLALARSQSDLSFKNKLDEYFTIKGFVYKYSWD